MTPGQTIHVGPRVVATQFRVRDIECLPLLWDGDNLLAELGASANTKIAEYSYYPGLDKLHALVVDTAAYYAHQDGLGNTIQLSKATTAYRSYDYTEWGVLKTATSADLLPFNGKDRARWKGALWMGSDSTQYYMRSRWYDTHAGRFLSEDPVGLAGGINRSVYASNDPVNKYDPRGLECYEVFYYLVWDLPGGGQELQYFGRGWEGDCAGGGAEGQDPNKCGPILGHRQIQRDAAWLAFLHRRIEREQGGALRSPRPG